jgi:hypothetical protein
MITILLSKTMMKSGIILCTVMVLLTGCTVSNGELPADFPADVPIISGEIYSARRTTFEDGPGFAVSVLTTLSCEEVFAFYADVVGPRGDGDVRVETICGDTETRYVSITVHLGGITGLNQEQFDRVSKLRPGAGLNEFIEVNIDDQ